ncbi:P8 [Pseudomonas phage phi2954]|uniref:p8 n=1 Tax=Pseudomonas phage phi2954 TaxID=593131 RepID=C0KIU4_9VIRU|nr:P8 [Pseudomonas phage phi2954]ACM91129.1 P8 [Pseudomonas phage phi2954]
MAKPPLRLPGVSGRAEKATAKPKMSKLDAAKAAVGAAGAAGTAVWGLDELLSFAQEHYPSAYGLVSGMFQEQGVDIESDAVKNGTGNTRANVLAAFARSGVDAAFIGSVGLSDQEKLGMLGLMAKYEQSMVAEVDKSQSARVSTGNQVLDRDIMVLEHARACELLGLTGPRRIKDLYLLVRTINTMTEAHVEAFEQYESIFGRARSRGTL